jgi:KDO2-lipid IV(A) lauroyltransferase
LWLGSRFGDLAFATFRRRRQIALENLRIAFPELSAEERRRLGRRSAQHLGMMGIELFRLLARPLEHTLRGVTSDGLEHLRAVTASHGRALILTAHLGNWEYLPAACHLTGYPLAIVVRPLDAGWLNALADEVRRKTDVVLIDKRAALRPIVTALREGRLVGVLLDQNAARSEGVFVPFFGRLASTSRSLAVLSLRTDTPVVPVFIHRERDGRHRVVVERPLEKPAARSSEAAIVELTAECTRRVEAGVRRWPDQWFWPHRRWRTRPPGERSSS